MGKKKKQKILPFKFDYPIIDNLKDQKLKEPEYVDVFSNSISMNPSILELLKDEKTSEDKRILIIENNFEYIIDEIHNRRYDYQELLDVIFINTTNLIVFMNVAKRKNITDSCRRVVNKICFDYLRSYSYISYIGQEYMNLIQLSEVINANILPGLYGIFTNDRFLADRLAIARYSDESTMRCVAHLNSIILPIPNIQTQTIVDIYSKLFDSVTDIFMGVMFDVTPALMTKESYSNISNATLYILNSLPTEDIKKVLYVYSNNIRLWKVWNVRFTLNSISNLEFPKVFNAVQYLREVDKIYLP